MKKLDILLVDDEVEYVTTLSERLAIRGFDNQVAHDGETALKIFAENPLDILLLDLKMPGIDGMDVLRKIRESNETLKVFILTGHGTDKEEEEARQLGVFDFMRKPVDINVLVEALQTAAEAKEDEIEDVGGG